MFSVLMKKPPNKKKSTIKIGLRMRANAGLGAKAPTVTNKLRAVNVCTIIADTKMKYADAVGFRLVIQ